MPISQSKTHAWAERFPGYRVEITPALLRTWCGQFADIDVAVAEKLLNSVYYMTHEDIRNSLGDAVRAIGGWHQHRKKRQGEWRFAALSSSPGESGDTMLQYVREDLGLSSSRYNSLFIYRSEIATIDWSPNDTLVLVDDFAGSGQQATTTLQLLSELLYAEFRKVVIFAAAYEKGKQRIENEFDGLVHSTKTLDAAHSPFRNPQFSQRDRQTLLKYCRKASSRLPKGFDSCALAVVLATKCPNNSVAVLHSASNAWTPLFPRHTVSA